MTTKPTRIEFDADELTAAEHWHDGQSSMLYAIASAGALSRGAERFRPYLDCDECDGRGWVSASEPCRCGGKRMTDDQWLVYLAEKLESEADASLDDAREQGDDEEAEALASIAAKCRKAIAELTPVTHLLWTRSGTVCGLSGPASADIEIVTCEKCIAHHDATINL